MTLIPATYPDKRQVYSEDGTVLWRLSVFYDNWLQNARTVWTLHTELHQECTIKYGGL